MYAAWEVSQSGSAESEEEIQAKLDAEFKPAYEVTYNNSTMIIGTDESLETINADVDAWGSAKMKTAMPTSAMSSGLTGNMNCITCQRKQTSM